VYVNTYFDATFDTGGISRLLTVNEATAQRVAQEECPGYEVIFAMVNSAQYGGSGGSVVAFSMHEAAAEIAIHESGHIIGRLADEYGTAYPGYPAGDPEGNVTYSIQNLKNYATATCTPPTDLTKDELISSYLACVGKKYWHQLIIQNWGGDDPEHFTVPTSDDYIDVIGMFKGARYLYNGIYRPKFTCMMRNLSQPFCEVCAKAMLEGVKLHCNQNSRPTTPVLTISPSNAHAAESVQASAVSADADGDPITYSWEIYGPAGLVTWSYPTTGQTITFTPPVPNQFTIYCTATDEHGEASIKVFKVIQVDCPAQITGIEPVFESGLMPRVLNISGTNFGNQTGGVVFRDAFYTNRTHAANVFLSWTDTLITVVVPAHPDLSLCNPGVEAMVWPANAGWGSGCLSQYVLYAAGPTAFCIDDSSDLSGGVNQDITIRGQGFSSMCSGTSTIHVTFCDESNTCKDGTIKSITDTTIVVTVPSGAPSGYMVVECRALNGTVLKSDKMSFTVATIAVTSPEEDDDWQVGTTHTISWTSSGVSGNVQIQLGIPDGCVYDYDAILIPGGTSTANDGSHSWTVSGNAVENCVIKVSSVSNSNFLGQSKPFNIVSTTTTSIRPTTSTTSVRPTTTTTSIRPTTSTTSVRPTTTTTSIRPTTSTTTINQAPLWGSIFQNQTVDENVALNYIIPAATDPEGNTPVTYSYVSMPGDANFYPLLRGFQWKPSYDAVPAGSTSKNYTITVRVTDSLGNYRNGTFTVTVNNVNRAPSVLVLMSFPGLTINKGETITLTATGNDPDTNDTLEYYWEMGSSATEFGTKTWQMIRGWSTTSGYPYIVPFYGKWIQFRCTVRDRSGATATDNTLIKYVYQ
jgi:hypothetical protein